MAVPPTDADARAVAKTMESMVDSKKLLELAKRVEREEPTWMLTLEIECALHPGAKIVRFASDETNAIKLGANHYRPMSYLTSVDAALTLVPKGYSVKAVHHPHMGGGDEAECYADVYKLGPIEKFGTHRMGRRPLSGPHEGRAPTPSAALCSAALRARAALGEDGAEDSALRIAR